MSLFSSNGTQIFYDLQGDGDKVITLINGHNRTHKDFRPMAKFLAQNGLTVLSLDNRGSGQSESTGSFKLADMATDVCNLWSHLQIEKSHVLGISMGGIIAMTVALSESQVVESLLLVSTAARTHWLSGETNWAEDYQGVYQKLRRYFSPSFTDRNKLLVESMAKQILSDVLQGNLVKRSIAQKNALDGFDARVGLGAIAVPVHVLHGRDDDIIPYAAAEELANCAHADLSSLDGVGHLILAEAPKTLYQWVLEKIEG
ncbi:MAG: alpha/beta fold hydrolase [Oligoflexales bacterium]